MWATSPLGTWTYGGLLSPDSFGGQPTFTGTWQTTDGRSIAVYQSDLWYHPGGLLERNQGLAGYNVSPVNWAPDGVTPLLPSTPSWTEKLRFADTGAVDATLPSSVFHAPNAGTWYVTCDVRSGTARSFTFQAPASGVLTDLKVPVARSEYPNAPGRLELSAGANAPGAAVLASATVPASGPGWTARPYVWHPDVTVNGGQTYTVALRSANTQADQSCFGFTYTAGASVMGQAYTLVGSRVANTPETVKFDLAIRPTVPRGATTVTRPVRLARRPGRGRVRDRRPGGGHDRHPFVGGDRGLGQRDREHAGSGRHARRLPRRRAGDHGQHVPVPRRGRPGPTPPWCGSATTAPSGWGRRPTPRSRWTSPAG